MTDAGRSAFTERELEDEICASEDYSRLMGQLLPPPASNTTEEK